MSKFSTAKQFINQIFGGSVKTTGTGAINKVDIAKNLKKRFDTKQEGFKSVDDQLKGTNVNISKKSKIKKEFSKAVSDAYDKFEGATKKAKGGRVGLKFGSKKSNVQKIKETFGPKKKVPNKFKGFSKLPEKVQQKIDAKLAKKV